MSQPKAPPETARVKLAHGATPINEGGVVNIGTHTVTLPGVEKQAEGFDLPVKDARRLLTQFPDRYKRMETAGVSQQAQQGEGQNQQQQGGQQGEGQSSDDIRDADSSEGADDADAEGQQDDVTDDEEEAHDAEKD